MALADGEFEQGRSRFFPWATIVLGMVAALGYNFLPEQLVTGDGASRAIPMLMVAGFLTAWIDKIRFENAQAKLRG